VEVRVEQVTFRCACCRRILPRNSRVKKQGYCGAGACQQARKNKWQREKQQTDPDYLANKRESQQGWQKRNPTYWQQYRSKNKDACERNRRMQQERDGKRRQATKDGNLAKKDALDGIFNDTTMTYFIYASEDNLAKKDALSVKIIPITPG
jgi:hypothetical protein